MVTIVVCLRSASCLAYLSAYAQTHRPQHACRWSPYSSVLIRHPVEHSHPHMHKPAAGLRAVAGCVHVACCLAYLDAPAQTRRQSSRLAGGGRLCSSGVLSGIFGRIWTNPQTKQQACAWLPYASGIFVHKHELFWRSCPGILVCIVTYTPAELVRVVAILVRQTCQACLCALHKPVQPQQACGWSDLSTCEPTCMPAAKWRGSPG